jgi:hypothetical protein
MYSPCGESYGYTFVTLEGPDSVTFNICNMGLSCVSSEKIQCWATRSHMCTVTVMLYVQL